MFWRNLLPPASEGKVLITKAFQEYACERLNVLTAVFVKI
jgi:hypothetical protein